MGECFSDQLYKNINALSRVLGSEIQDNTAMLDPPYKRLSADARTTLVAAAEFVGNYLDFAPHTGPIVRQVRQVLPEGAMLQIPNLPEYACRLVPWEEQLLGMRYGVTKNRLGLFTDIGKITHPCDIEDPAENSRVPLPPYFQNMYQGLANSARLPVSYVHHFAHVLSLFISAGKLGGSLYNWEEERMNVQAAQFEVPNFLMLSALSDIGRIAFLEDIAKSLVSLYDREWHDWLLKRQKVLEGEDKKLCNFPISFQRLTSFLQRNPALSNWINHAAAPLALGATNLEKRQLEHPGKVGCVMLLIWCMVESHSSFVLVFYCGSKNSRNGFWRYQCR
jgi:hypothetical protein